MAVLLRGRMLTLNSGDTVVANSVIAFSRSEQVNSLPIKIDETILSFLSRTTYLLAANLQVEILRALHLCDPLSLDRRIMLESEIFNSWLAHI